MTPEESGQAGHDEELKNKRLAKYSAAAGILQKGGALPSEGAAGGAVSGAMAGAAFGPAGAAVGAVAGGIMGAAQSREAAKQHNAQLEAQKNAALGQIEQDKEKQIQGALHQMGVRMRIS